jgi:hypothetical protein
VYEAETTQMILVLKENIMERHSQKNSKQLQKLIKGNDQDRNH